MVRKNNFLRKTKGPFYDWLWDLVFKPIGVMIVVFVYNFLGMLKTPVVDKRCHLFMQAVTNTTLYAGDNGLVGWFQKAKWKVYLKLFGADNAYISRDFMIFEEYVSLLKAAEAKGERFPNGKTKDYVDREIIHKKYHKI